MVQRLNLKLEIFQAENKEWSYRVIRGARIIFGPEETYKLRGGCRRAVRHLADIASIKELGISTPLQAACLKGLDVEQAAWDGKHGRHGMKKLKPDC